MRTINSYRHPVDRYKLGMLGAFEFEEPAADLAFDSVGANNGTRVGATVNQASVSKGYSFNGSSNFINLPNAVANDLAGSNTWAVSFWASGAYQTNGAGFSLNVDGNSPSQIFIFYPYDTSGGNGFRIYYNGNTLIDENSATRTGWNHFVFVSESVSFHKVYVNGVLIATSTTNKTLNASLNKAFIGKIYDTGDQYYSGGIDQVRLYDSPLTIEQVNEIYNYGRGVKYIDSPASINNNLVGLWELDETLGTNVVDSLGVNDGTNNGATVNQQGAVSNLEKCYYFDGSNDYVDVNDTFDDIIAGADKKFSMSAFINLNNPTTGAAQVIMSKLADSGMGANERQFSFAVNSNGKVYVVAYGTVFADNFRAYESDLILSANTWYHVVISYDGSIDTNDGLNRLKVYIDGVSRTVILSSVQGGLPDIPTSPAHFGIGSAIRSDGTTTGYEFGGKIDQPCIWAKIITSSEVVQIYNSGKGLNYTDWSASLKTNLVSLWGFNEKASSLIAHDSHTPFQATTVSSIVPIPNRTGKVGKCFEYVTGDYMITKPDYFPVGSNKISFSLWLYCHVVPTSAYRYYEVMGANFGTSWAAPYYLWTFKIYIRSPDRNFFAWHLGDGTTSVGLSSAVNTYQANVWTHICGVWDGDYMALYKNGALMVDGTGKNAISGVNMTGANFLMGRIGGGKPSTYYGFDGLLDQIFLWDNYVLTPDQVAWLYNGGNGRTYDELT